MVAWLVSLLLFALVLFDPGAAAPGPGAAAPAPPRTGVEVAARCIDPGPGLCVDPTTPPAP